MAKQLVRLGLLLLAGYGLCWWHTHYLMRPFASTLWCEVAIYANGEPAKTWEAATAPTFDARSQCWYFYTVEQELVAVSGNISIEPKAKPVVRR